MSDVLLMIGGAIFLVGGICAVMVAVRRARQAQAWREEAAAIAECAMKDRMEAEQLELLRKIYARWPETVKVVFDPRQTLTRAVEDLVHGGPLVWETLLELYRSWPTSVVITLHPRRHKMQICDADRVGLAVTVSHFVGERMVRSNPWEEVSQAGREGVQGREERGKGLGGKGGDWSRRAEFVSGGSAGLKR